MDQALYGIIETYGIYAVFLLCTVEGDLTLLLSGVLAQSGFFGPYSFLKVIVAGTLGGVAGDTFGYFVGRFFRHTVRDYRFYRMAQPRIERLVDNFGGYAIIMSKYIYGIRAGMCIFNGVARMPLWRFVAIDTVSCFIWSSLLAGAGFFFSGFVTSIIGDFQQIGKALFVIVVIGIAGFYLLERFWLSKKVETANPETIQKFEVKLHNIEEVAQEKLQGIGERLHLTSTKDSEVETEKEIEEKKNAAKK
jgi:membrane protein DedA with SNARE-associated domain